jgi:hypothetical protein
MPGTRGTVSTAYRHRDLPEGGEEEVITIITAIIIIIPQTDRLAGPLWRLCQEYDHTNISNSASCSP